MRIGKVTPAVLSQIVFSQLGKRRSDVLVHSALGEDSTVIDFGDSVVVLSTDPITGAARNQGWLGVHICCNDVAAMGAEPIGVLVTLLLDQQTTVDQAARIMADVDRAARELGIEVLGGHSEVTSAVTQPVVSFTAIGRASKSSYVTSAGARLGDALLMTKAAGLEGTAVLAADRATWLAPIVGIELLHRAAAFIDEISVVAEGIAAARAGATAMHDATEGGILGAVYELAAASRLGVDLETDLVPVRSETRAICQAFGIDPLRLVSSGALVIATGEVERVSSALTDLGIEVATIGRLTSGPRRTLTSAGERELAPPEGDELWVALARCTE